MEYNTNYTENWEGQTGQQVRETIQGALNKHEQGIKNSLSGIEFVPDEVDKSTLYYRYKYVDGSIGELDTENQKLTVQPTSSSILDVNILDVDNQGSVRPRYVQHGNSVTVNYEIEFRTVREGIETKVQVSDIKIKLKGQDIANAVSTRTTNQKARGSFVIPASYLEEGENNLQIAFVSNYGGTTITNVSLKVYSIAISISTNFDVGQVRGTSFTVPVTVTNSKGGSLIAGLPTVTNSLYYYSGAINGVEQSTSNSVSIDFSNKTGFVPGTQRLFLQSGFVVSSETDSQGNALRIVSNIILLNVIVLDGNESQSQVFTATKLPVAEVTGDTLTVYAYRYNPITIPVYAYSHTSATLSNSLTGQNNLEVTPDTLTDLSFEYTFKNLGNTSLLIGNFNPTITVLASGDSFEEPYGVGLDLNTQGKTVGYPVWDNTTFTVEVDGIGNGFQKDQDNKVGLLLNNGAGAYINYAPCVTNEYTVSFKYRVQGSIVNEKLIECVANNTGFELYPEKVVMLHMGVTLQREFDSDSIHEITLVSYGSSYQNLMIIYIDGSMQAVAQKGKSTYTHNTGITLHSNSSNFFLYSLKTYNRALSYTEVQSLYGLNLNNAEEISAYVQANNVFNTNTTSIKAGGYGDNVKISTLPVGAVYLLLESFKAEGETESQDPTPWDTINGYLSDPESQKGIYHYLGSVKLIKKTADGSADQMNFYAKRATLAGQGTSSMDYPAKNFRIAFGKAISSKQPYENIYTGVETNLEAGNTEDFYTNVTPDFDIKSTITGTGTHQSSAKYAIEGGQKAKIFCLKADFAESSGSHNTGFARMVDYVMRNSGDISISGDANFSDNPLLPQQRVVSNVRSTINGFPIYLFVKQWNQSDKDAIFYGKYNFNDEKSSKNVFGFEGIDDYYSLETVKTEAATLKNLFSQTALQTNSGFNYTRDIQNYDNVHYSIEINGEEIINPTECWEFSSNSTTLNNSSVGDLTNIGAFQYPYTMKNTYPKYSQYSEKDPFTLTEDGHLLWLNYNDGQHTYGSTWEYRYPGLETTPENIQKAASKYATKHKHNDYVDSVAHNLYTNVQNPTQPLLLKSLYKWIYKHNINVLEQANITSTMEDFAKNLSKYFNLNYLLKYFVLTKLFGNVDQRIKNCMLSFYCDQDVASNTDLESPMGHMRAFYIFYDNDTILGVDNIGALTQDWNIDEEKYPGYGSHGIWSNLEYCFNQYVNNNNLSATNSIYKLGKMIEDAYQTIRETLSGDQLFNFFDRDQVDKYSDAIFNVDAEIKYFYPNRHFTPESESSKLSVPNRVQDIHGNRKYHRKRWLSKRASWLDARYYGPEARNNYIRVKFGTGRTDIVSGDIIMKSAVDKWRFFLSYQSKLLGKTGLVDNNVSSTLSIRSGQVNISDFVSIQGLQGCSYLNLDGLVLSKTEGNETVYAPYSDVTFGGKANYLKQFIVSSYGNGKRISDSALIKLMHCSNNESPADIYPNLEELQIASLTESAGGHFASIDLSDLSKLKSIDARGTLVNIVLPSSKSLTTLKLQAPSELSVSNKPNLSTFTIEDSSSLVTLNIGVGNSSTVYDKLFALAQLNTVETITIKLGTESQPYAITDAQLTTLVNLAPKLPSNAVTGYIFNANVDISQRQVLNKFNGLVVSDNDNSPFNISGPNLLTEGGTITISPNKLLNSIDDWIVNGASLQNGQSSIGDAVYFTFTPTQSSLTIHANELDYLQGNKVITVKAYYAGSESNTITITAQYIPISGITISAEQLILNPSQVQEIQVSLSPEDTTKRYLLNNGQLTIGWNSDKVTQDSNTYRYYYTMGNESEIVTASYNGVAQNSIEFIKNEVIINNWNTVNTADSPLYWIYKIFYKLKGQSGIYEYQTVSISDISNIELTDTLKSEITSVFSESNKVSQDLNYLKYFNYRSTAFNIPSEWEFTNISIPDNKSTNVTQVTWIYNGNDTGFETILFPSTLTQAKLELSGSSLFSSLVLDLSNTKITKIYNSGQSNPDNYSVSVNITHPTNVALTTANPLFIYPSTLQVLGNYQNIDGQQDPIGMFNREGVALNSNIAYTPTYSLGNPVANILRNISVGLIFGYPVTNDINLGCNANRITNTYYTFYNTSFLPASPQNSGDPYSFSSIINFGKYTLFENKANISIVLNTLVERIGKNALQGFSGSITSTVSSNGSQLFSKLNLIDDYAFAYIPAQLNFTISNSSEQFRTVTIGDNAFALTNDITGNASNPHHTIIVTGNITLDITSSTAFGTGKRNTLKITSAIETELKKLSVWEALNNNVNIVVV